MEEKVSKFFCSCCGKWLGGMTDQAVTDGIYPYCPRCKKPVTISSKQYQRVPFKDIKKSAECRQR